MSWAVAVTKEDNMARAALYKDGEQIAERGLRVPKRVEKIEAWSKAARKCFSRELGETSALPPTKHIICNDTNTIRLGYSDGVGILIRRGACPIS